MNTLRQSPPPPVEMLTGRQTLWYLLPFFTSMVFPMFDQVPGNFFYLLLLGLLLLVLWVLVNGFFYRLPLWSLPSLGLVISLVNLLLLSSQLDPTPGLFQLKALLWTDFMPARVLYALIHDFLDILPVMLLLVGLALLSTGLPALATFRHRLGRDWTLLPLLLYTTNLITPLNTDSYRWLEPYQIGFLLILMAGAWLYLRTSRPVTRLGILLAATLLSGLALSLGIYLLYPRQFWVIFNIGAVFPRWWETLSPLLNTLIWLAGLGLMASFGSRLSQWINTSEPKTSVNTIP